MCMSRNRGVLIIAISIAVFLGLIFASAYAILSASVTEGSKNISTSLGSRPIFTAAPSKSIALDNIPYIETTSSKEFIISQDNADIDVSLTTSYDAATTCTYDILWRWDETLNLGNQYHITTGETKEYTILGTSDFDDSFSEMQIGDYNGNNLDTVLHTSSITVDGSGLVANQKWSFRTAFYKTKAIQTSHKGASYSGKIVIDNVTCTSSNS